MPLYRVCLIAPPDNPHAACFREIALLLVSALHSNNLNCDFAVNQMSPQHTNILVGYHLLNFNSSIPSFNYIPYQLEQLFSNDFPFTDNIKNILKHGSEVWDYSNENIALLQNMGIKAKLLIPGFHPNLETIPVIPNNDRNIDILFYGSIGPRRQFILSELDKRCKVKVLFGVYGEKRDQWIKRSKMILNIHHYSTQLFEAVRISYLLNNNCLVVSEASAYNPYPSVSLTSVQYDDLIETSMSLLNDIENMKLLRRKNYEEFKKNYPMTELIKHVISH